MRSPSLKRSPTFSSLPTSRSPPSRNSRSTETILPAFLRCSRSALVRRCVFFSPKPTCTAEYPSLPGVRFCTTVHGPAWITVTGTSSPPLANTWVMPSFLPINPSLPSLPWVMPCSSLQLDLDVDARGEIELAERVDRLLRGLEDVEQPLVGAHLELLARFLVDVRRAVDREPLDARGQRNRARDAAAG